MTTRPIRGCTLEQYAEKIGLHPTILQAYGVATTTDPHTRQRAVALPYYDERGQEVAVKLRLTLEKGIAGRFRWVRDSAPCLYGLRFLHDLPAPILNGHVPLAADAEAVLVEGESDAQVLWAHGERALGLPGANGWKEERDALILRRFTRIYVVREPDSGGDAVLRWLGASSIRDRAWVITMLADVKDPAALYRADPARFPEVWAALKAVAQPWSEVAAAEAEAAAAEAAAEAEAEAAAAAAERRAQVEAAEAVCRDLAREPDILACLRTTLRQQGLVGEEQSSGLIYLALTSRLLRRPANLLVKAQSATGKSYVVELVCSLFPDSEVYLFTAASAKALVYDPRDYVHKVLAIVEATALEGDGNGEFSYLVRSLLSEGRLRYQTVQKAQNGKMVGTTIEKDGPTGCIVTTTAANIHAENETRHLSVAVDESSEQTRRVLRAIAEREGIEDARPSDPDADVDDSVSGVYPPTTWQALQTWLAGDEPVAVVVPFAAALAHLIPPLAVRLRRDMTVVLALVKAHAWLHKATRERDAEGRVVATLAQDYVAVRKLVADLVAEGVAAHVPPAVREIVGVVAAIVYEKEHPKQRTVATIEADYDEHAGRYFARVVEIKARLHCDQATVSRRLHVARERGYLANLETREKQPGRWILHDALPDEQAVLPTTEDVAAEMEAESYLADVLHQPGASDGGRPE